MKRRLRVDIVACDGVGICAHLASGLVRVDSWGYPIIEAHQLTRTTGRQARAAVQACPRRALFIESDGVMGGP
ncbi:MAG TPA: ferredoxin [Jatrophihabitans sp.]|nr:ferredoxin [Jatrophihabitans sp.]